MKYCIYLVSLLSCISILNGQTLDEVFYFDEFRYPKQRKNIQIPTVKNYQVLKCDFHMHTVFTDGHVWPNVRVQEAWREGLDVISFTEHMEYNPFHKDVKVDHNRSHDLAQPLADEHNLMLIKGTEVTRNTPPGHFNALFIQDATALVNDRNAELDQLAIDKVVEQNAFIFWNHPGWKTKQIPGSYEWIDFVEKMYQEQKLHGIEVVNNFGFHKKALDWALDRNLTILGNTDIHSLIAHEYNLEKTGIHRTMTLVFAKEKTQQGIREALEAGRTLAWSSKYLIGREDLILDLFAACVTVSPAFHQKNNKINYHEVVNNSDLYFELMLDEGKGTQKIILYPHSTQILTAEKDQSSLQYELVSAYSRSDKHPIVKLAL